MFLPSALAQADNPRLVGTVGRNDTFTIALQDPSGKAVTSLEPGTYDIEVHDLSEEHNFHLVGPGVDQATDIAAAQDVVWTVTFTNGTYRFQCDAHSTTMRGRCSAGRPIITQLSPITSKSASAACAPGGSLCIMELVKRRVAWTQIAKTTPCKVEWARKAAEASLNPVRRYRG